MQLRQVTENECSVKCLMKNPTECEVGANSYNASKTKESRRLLNWVSSTLKKNSAHTYQLLNQQMKKRERDVTWTSSDGES